MTQPTPSSRSTEPPEDEDQPQGRLGLSMTQVIGGSLAAVTAAFLGSRLGVAGTLIGTAIASVVSAVGAAVYTESLRRARVALKTAKVPGLTHADDAPATPGDAPTTAEPLPELGDLGDTAATRPLRTTATGDGSITVQTRGPIRLNLKRILVTTVAIFVLAAVAVTGIELVKGSALDGRSGTTISQIGGSSSQETTPAPTDSSTSSTPSATQTTTDEPTVSESSPSANPTTGDSFGPTESESPSSSSHDSHDAGSTPSPTSSAGGTQPPGAAGPTSTPTSTS